tara:strand:- start:30 stop:152 length:123 start_codon:yes stop_codon:yes gene_type:complete
MGVGVVQCTWVRVEGYGAIDGEGSGGLKVKVRVRVRVKVR